MRDGLVDWDCSEALSLPDMQRALAHIRATGTFPVSPRHGLPQRSDHGCAGADDHSFPFLLRSVRRYPTTRTRRLPTPAPSQPDLDSKEDRNSVGRRPVSDLQIEGLKATVQAWRQPGQPGHGIFEEAHLRICLLDGFLLYSPAMASVAEEIDIKLFLVVSRGTATRRREARDGYVTLEGFWKDPPGYVDKIVWPNYVAAHEGLFVDGDVEGRLDQQVLRAKGILAPVEQSGDIEMESTLAWAVNTLMVELPRFR